MKLWERCRQLIEENELLRYLIAGVLTTLVNLVTLTVLGETFGYEQKLFFNTIAIIASIIFAFFINRNFVFKSEQAIWPEFIAFFSSRFLVSLFLDNGSYLFFYDILGIRSLMPIIRVQWAKIFGQVFVVILNYVLGKFLIFKSGKKESSSSSDE